ncbi:MAG: hypothetical protein JWN40_957 [Phycisphaerales bacterium]|nr:hypothetical protein [Phycisphaerales bacterium]
MSPRTTTIIALLLLAIAPTLRADPNQPPADNAPKLDFPKVEGWEKTDIRPLPAESGGGYSVAYSSAEPRIVITIYVFNRGLARIDDNLTSPAIQEEFASAKDAIQEATRRGIYKQAKEEESGQATLGTDKSTVKTLYARFHLTTKDNGQAISEIFVLPHQNHFIKLRVTRLGEDRKTTQVPLDKLYAELAKMLTR